MELRKFSRIAVLSALAFALMFLGEVPIPMIPGAKFDLSEIPAVLAALGMGPVAGLAVEVVKDLLFFVSGKSQAGLVGVAANLTAGGTLVLMTGLVSNFLGLQWGQSVRNPAQYWLRGAASALVGTVAMAAVMLVVNAYVFIPIWFQQPGVHWGPSAAWFPFNLIKGALASAAALAFHRRLESFIAGRPARNAA